MQPEFESFIEDHPQWSASTRALYRGWSLTFQEFLSTQGLSWQTAQRQDLEAFQQRLLWTPNGFGGLQSPNTIYQGLRLLRAFYDWAAKTGGIVTNPMQGWVLSRPPSQSRSPLTWEQTQQIFCQPDLGRPEGHRDLLLLHLVYQGLSLSRCRHLLIDSDVPGDDTLLAVRTRYLLRARPRLVGAHNCPELLVTDRGWPFGSSTGLSLRLKRYLRRLNVWILWDSRRAHEAEIGKRFGQNSQK